MTCTLAISNGTANEMCHCLWRLIFDCFSVDVNSCPEETNLSDTSWNVHSCHFSPLSVSCVSHYNICWICHLVCEWLSVRTTDLIILFLSACTDDNCRRFERWLDYVSFWNFKFTNQCLVFSVRWCYRLWPGEPCSRDGGYEDDWSPWKRSQPPRMLHSGRYEKMHLLVLKILLLTCAGPVISRKY